MTLTGTCGIDDKLTIYCDDDDESWTHGSLVCSTGDFAEQVNNLDPGEETSCYGTMVDSAGNISIDSNTVSTRHCANPDLDELAGLYNSGPLANNLANALDDSNSTTLKASGNALPNTEDGINADDLGDWYRVTATDDLATDEANGYNNYNVSIKLANGGNKYSFIVYREANVNDPFGTSPAECETATNGYTEYNFYPMDVGDGTHAPPSNTRECGDDSEHNRCEDFTAEYYVHVFLNAGESPTCKGYDLEITNGDWSTTPP